MKTNCALAVVVTLLSLSGEAVSWKNLDEDHHLGGRRASEGYLQGKVVLVDRWGVRCPPCRVLLPRIEAIWQGFKTKPFVVLGGHVSGWGRAADVKALVDEHKLTYSIYEGAGLAEGEPSFNAIPFLYVVDETGKVIYKGHDEREATQHVVSALTDMEAPKNLNQWRYFLDYEIENLPGRATLRLKEFKKKFPAEAKTYAEKEKTLATIPDVKKLAELVEFAKKAKDMREFSAKQQAKKAKFAKMIDSVLSKYEPLKESKDPRVVQEAKNALADLVWTKAEL